MTDLMRAPTRTTDRVPYRPRAWSPAVRGLLLMAAVSLGVVAFDAYRVLSDGGFFLFEPGPVQAEPMSVRLEAVVQVANPQRLLELVLGCLALSAWLAGSAGARRTRQATRFLACLLSLESGCLAVVLGLLAVRPPARGDLAAVFGPDRLVQVSGPLLSAVLLTVLPCLLARPPLADSDVPPLDPVAGPGRPRPPLPRDSPDDDPHAPYRRPVPRS